MKQKLFTLFAMLICSISMYAGGTKVVYTVFDEDTGTLTYRYDSKYDHMTRAIPIMRSTTPSIIPMPCASLTTIRR